MCLNIKLEDKEQKAICNIPVYKMLYGCKSVHNDFRYWRFIKNKVVEFSINTRHWRHHPTTVEIDQGYHSRKPCNRDRKSHLFVIPKHAKYYEGFENDSNLKDNRTLGYVSNTIIYVGKNNTFNRWIGKLFYGVKFQSEKEMKYGL